MSTITFRTNEEEKKLIKDYATFNGLSMSEYVKIAILEKIEDEHDYVLAEERFAIYNSNKEETVSIDDALRDLGV